MQTTEAPAAPAPPLWEQVQAYFQQLLALDPAQAALRGGLTLLVFLGAALVLWGMRLLLKTLVERFAPGPESASDRRHKIGRWSLRIARLALVVGALIVVLRIWGLDVAAFLNSPLGAVVRSGGHIAVVLVLSLAAIEISQVAITHTFSRVALRARNARRAAQLRTLSPVMTGLATTTLVTIATLTTLSEVGIEIGPLLAGAGIVGLAIGFGAQTLVKDLLTGIFLIIEDTVSIGDVVRVGDSSGLVEDMSLRTIKLRDFDGTLHVIPYSEAQVIHNMTKNFSFYVFNLSISYSSDIRKALDLMKEVGDGIAHDPAFKDMVLEPIEIVGVDQLADSGVVLKARIKTLPIKQWAVGREYLKRIKLAFDAAGVEIPFPHVKLVPPDQPIPLNENPFARSAG